MATNVECSSCGDGPNDAVIEWVNGKWICIPCLETWIQNAATYPDKFPLRVNERRININKHASRLDPGIVAQYRQIQLELDTPRQHRLYCRSCEAWLGNRTHYSDQAPQGIQCTKCGSGTCRLCGNTHEGLPGHTCDPGEAAWDESERGDAWQICPNPDCKALCGRIDACNEMRCGDCETKYCNVCGQDMDDVDDDHFDIHCWRWPGSDGADGRFNWEDGTNWEEQREQRQAYIATQREILDRTATAFNGLRDNYINAQRNYDPMNPSGDTAELKRIRDEAEDALTNARRTMTEAADRMRGLRIGHTLYNRIRRELEESTGHELGDFAPENDRQRSRRIRDNVSDAEDSLALYLERQEELVELQDVLAGMRSDEPHRRHAIMNLEALVRETGKELDEARKAVEDAAAELRTTHETRSQYIELQREVRYELPSFDRSDERRLDPQRGPYDEDEDEDEDMGDDEDMDDDEDDDMGEDEDDDDADMSIEPNDSATDNEPPRWSAHLTAVYEVIEAAVQSYPGLVAAHQTAVDNLARIPAPQYPGQLNEDLLNDMIENAIQVRDQAQAAIDTAHNTIVTNSNVMRTLVASGDHESLAQEILTHTGITVPGFRPLIERFGR